DIQRDNMFWNRSKSGLGILATKENMEIYRLGYEVAQSVKVGDTFHILPLLKQLGGSNEAFLADLSRDRVDIYHFDGEEAFKMDPEGVETEFTSLFEDFDPQDHSSHGNFGNQHGTIHANWTKSDEEENERE